MKSAFSYLGDCVTSRSDRSPFMVKGMDRRCLPRILFTSGIFFTNLSRIFNYELLNSDNCRKFYVSAELKNRAEYINWIARYQISYTGVSIFKKNTYFLLRSVLYNSKYFLLDSFHEKSSFIALLTSLDHSTLFSNTDRALDRA